MAKKILLVAHNLDDFVGQDLELLRKHYTVRVVTMGSFLESLENYSKLREGIQWCDLAFIWFGASYAMFATGLCKRYKKKSIIIAGGHDVVKMPEINYGLLCGTFTQYFPKLAFKRADKILAFSEKSRKDLVKNFPGTQSKAETVYLGVKSKKYSAGLKKQNMVVTIGEIKHANIKRKGYETLIKTAENFPKVEFVFIGKIMDLAAKKFSHMAPPNVQFTGFLKFSKLKDYLQKSKVYAQLSAHEGFGLGLAEGMLCECIPVATKRGSLPEIAGNTGFYTRYGSIKETTEAIKKALRSNKGKQARKRIIEKFPVKAREQKLIKEINALIREGE